RRASELMLQPGTWQVRAKGTAKGVVVAKGWAKKLHSVGCKAARAIKTAVRDPRDSPALRLGLPAHDDGPIRAMLRDMVVDILRRVGLVVHQKPALAEPEVLDQYGIGSFGSFGRIRDIDAPEPSGLARMQGECHAVAKAFCLAVPHKTVFGHAKPDVGV